MSTSELVEQQKALRAKLAELAGRGFDRQSIAVQPLAEQMESTEASAMIDVTIALLSQDTATYHKVEEALSRIRRGAYGECLRCGEAIAAIRLRALPWADLCRRCQEHSDRNCGRARNWRLT